MGKRVLEDKENVNKSLLNQIRCLGNKINNMLLRNQVGSAKGMPVALAKAVGKKTLNTQYSIFNAKVVNKARSIIYKDDD